MTETPAGEEAELDGLVDSLNLNWIDLILVEGYRHLSFPKIELHRPSTNKDLIYPEDDDVIAVASDEIIATGRLPLLDINKPQEIADFIQDWLGV